MIIDLKPLLSGQLSRIDFDYIIEIDNEDCPVLPPDDVSFTAPVSVKGFITDNAGYMSLNAEAEIEYSSRCARCLEDISGKFVLKFNRIVANSGTLQNEQSDGFIVAKNGLLDIDRELVEDLLLEFPSSLLCKEECAGLCPNCAKNLNFGPCDCPKKKEIDPRLAILQKLLEND